MPNKNTPNSEAERCHQRMLDNRGIREACPKCGGYGVITYGNTSTWRHGCGGQAMTNDVCEECWGSGDIRRKWVNLRTLPSKAEYDKCVNLHDELVEALITALDWWTATSTTPFDEWHERDVETFNSLNDLVNRAKGEDHE